MKTTESAPPEQSNLEDAVKAAIAKRIGGDPEILESSNAGVVPIVRLDGYEANIDWQEIAAELARETGVAVTCIANCDWSLTDGPDEEATWIAFDVPGLPAEYRDDEHRNLIALVDPATAPSQRDFDRLKVARAVVKFHIAELEAKKEQLVTTRQPAAEIERRIEDIVKLKALEAEDREAVDRIIDLDFDGAVAAASEPAPTPAP